MWRQQFVDPSLMNVLSNSTYLHFLTAVKFKNLCYQRVLKCRHLEFKQMLEIKFLSYMGNTKKRCERATAECITDIHIGIFENCGRENRRELQRNIALSKTRLHSLQLFYSFHAAYTQAMFEKNQCASACLNTSELIQAFYIAKSIINSLI